MKGATELFEEDDQENKSSAQSMSFIAETTTIRYSPRKTSCRSEFFKRWFWRESCSRALRKTCIMRLKIRQKLAQKKPKRRDDKMRKLCRYGRNF